MNRKIGKLSEQGSWNAEKWHNSNGNEIIIDWQRYILITQVIGGREDPSWTRRHFVLFLFICSTLIQSI